VAGRYEENQLAYRRSSLQKGDALGGFLCVVGVVGFVFDAEVALPFLPVHFLQNPADIARARAPRDALRRRLAELVDILQVERHDVTFQLLQRFDRLEPRTDPVPRVAAGADPRSSVPHHLQRSLRVVIARGGWMIVDRHLDLILGAQFGQHVVSFERRFGDQVLDAHVLGELEDGPSCGFGIEVPAVQAHHVHAQTGQVLGNFLARRGRHGRVGLQVAVLGAQLLPLERLDRIQPQRRHLLERLVERQLIERIGGTGHSPAEFRSIRSSLGRFGTDTPRPTQAVKRHATGQRRTSLQKTTTVE
jgi:hypothetical protein